MVHPSLSIYHTSIISPFSKLEPVLCVGPSTGLAPWLSILHPSSHTLWSVQPSPAKSAHIDELGFLRLGFHQFHFSREQDRRGLCGEMYKFYLEDKQIITDSMRYCYIAYCMLWLSVQCFPVLEINDFLFFIIYIKDGKFCRMPFFLM